MDESNCKLKASSLRSSALELERRTSSIPFRDPAEANSSPSDSPVPSAIFDLDGTLLNGDSTARWMRGLLERSKLRLLGAVGCVRIGRQAHSVDERARAQRRRSLNPPPKGIRDWRSGQFAVRDRSQPPLSRWTSQGQASQHLLHRKSGDIQNFLARGVPSDDANRVFGDAERAGQEREDLLIGSPAFGCGNDAHLDPVGVPSDDCRLPSTRRDTHVQERHLEVLRGA